SSGGNPRFGRDSSDGVQAGFAGPDADGFLDVGDEDLAVADAAGLRRATDRLDGFFDHVVAEHNLDFYLGEKIHHILRPAIELGMAFLTAEALGLGDGDTLQSDLLQRLLYLVEFEGLDDRLDFFHCVGASRLRGQSPASRAVALAGSVPSGDGPESLVTSIG